MHARWLVVALCLTGCKSPREKYEAAVRVRLAELPAFVELTKRAPSASDATEKTLSALTDFSAKYLESNALLIHLEELENPTLRRALPMRLNQRSPTVDAAAALALTRPDASAMLDEGYSTGLESESNMNGVWVRLGTLRYLLVVRTTGFKEATLLGQGTFEGGGWAGDIVVFDVDSKVVKGVFALTGTQHSRVKTVVGRDSQNLAADLGLALRGNLNARVRQLFHAVGAGDELN